MGGHSLWIGTFRTQRCCLSGVSRIFPGILCVNVVLSGRTWCCLGARGIVWAHVVLSVCMPC
jgi:hypothetical protein